MSLEREVPELFCRMECKKDERNESGRCKKSIDKNGEVEWICKCIRRRLSENNILYKFKNLNLDQKPLSR